MAAQLESKEMAMLDNKRVLLCVTGGIAVYKAAELARLLMKEGAEVRVAMTPNACQFVSPLTFQALTQKPVALEMFDATQEAQISHIALARWPEVIVVVPATANTLGKLAHGIADNLVSTLLLATQKQLVVAPAMNWSMWRHEATQANVAILNSWGRVKIVEPSSGELACGEQGEGKLAELADILDAVVYAASREHRDLEGETVLLTAGPTAEDIDPVRYLTNRSSGKMGYALAREARSRGAKVILISGPVALRPPYDVEFIPVRSAEEMARAVLQNAPKANIIIKAAAVADYRPSRVAEQKIHKTTGDFLLTLIPTTDILKELGARKRPDQFLVGYAAETNQVLEQATRKLREKNLNLIVVNDISQEGAGFDVDTNIVKIIDPKGHVDALPMLSKAEVAHALFEVVQKKRAEKFSRNQPRYESAPAPAPLPAASVAPLVNGTAVVPVPQSLPAPSATNGSGSGRPRRRRRRPIGSPAAPSGSTEG